MTVVDAPRLRRSWAEPAGLVAWFATVDHKRIGTRYMATALVFFFLGGLEAAALRAQLARPEERLLSPEAYDQLFSMHGLTMIFLFATPMLSGFGNYFVPLQIGARDMAFPKLNALGYWIFLGAGLFMYSGLVLGKAPNAGWFNYVPLSAEQFDSGPNIDFYGLGLIFLGISTTAGAINFIVTIAKLRAPGMSINRIPLFCWAVLGTSLAIVFAIPALTAASGLLELDRLFGFRIFDLSGGGNPVLWQHLFWIFGHPDVYIIFLPAVGIVSTIVPTFARRPMVAYTWMALATMMRLAAAKKTMVVAGRPVANMWCTHTPNPMNATSSSATATSGNAAIIRRVNVGMIEVAIPNAGSTMMYTSGWPKIQKRCCHRSGSPPWAMSKNLKPSFLSSSRNTRSAVSGGSAKMSENDVARIA